MVGVGSGMACEEPSRQCWRSRPSLKTLAELRWVVEPPMVKVVAEILKTRAPCLSQDVRHIAQQEPYMCLSTVSARHKSPHSSFIHEATLES